jgi:hypothetical protein
VIRKQETSVALGFLFLLASWNAAAAVPEAEGPEGKLGVGFSTISPANFELGSLAALFRLDSANSFQFHISMPRTSALNLGGILLYKRLLVKTQSTGFHIGGGGGVANVDNGAGSIFAFNGILIGGFYFSIPGIPRIQAHLDGGLNFYLLNTSPTTQRQLTMAPLSSYTSPSLGLSIFYYL